MFKSVFDTSDQCGEQHPLVTLSKNFGQANSQIGSGAERSIQAIIPEKDAAKLFAQEYLANVAQKTAAPSTFDMRQMLAQLPQQRLGQQMEEMWAKAEQSTRVQQHSNELVDQFMELQQNGWAEEFAQQKQIGTMEKAWQSAQAQSTWAKDFLEQYDNSSNSSSPSHLQMEQPLAQQWEEEFLKQMAEWRNVQKENMEQPEFFDYESAWEAANSKEAQERYTFAQENPFLDEAYPVEQAMRAFREGRVADSILHYEAALQREPNNVDTWYSLGLALAENEEDPRAISALRNALKLNGRHKEALLALAVSLANESFEHLALHELHKWICVHTGEQMPADHPASMTAMYGQYSQLDRAEFGELEQQFLQCAQTAQQADPELQNALSVLYNLGRDYDRAVDCVQAALSLRTEDPVLWNRLGATLANADRSAEAINAYKRALQLFPSYVRARYNLGISCMNLNSHRNAAVHFVAALQIQNAPDQSQIWSKLRSALIRLDSADFTQEYFDALDRRDLPKVVEFLQKRADFQ